MKAALAALMLAAAAPAVAQDVDAPGEVAAKVYFEWDSVAAPVEFHKVLDGLADKLKARAWKSITLEAHTDGSVAREYALGLGSRWAESVKEELVRRGIHPSGIRTISYGNMRPAIAAEGREVLNRRVEIRVVWE